MVAEMTPTQLGLITALFLLLMGVLEYLVFLHAAYPSKDEEGQPLDHTQPIPPGAGWVTGFVRFQSFVLMPVLGYVLGSRFLPSLTGHQ
jgi:hypothetical protein